MFHAYMFMIFRYANENYLNIFSITCSVRFVLFLFPRSVKDSNVSPATANSYLIQPFSVPSSQFPSCAEIWKIAKHFEMRKWQKSIEHEIVYYPPLFFESKYNYNLFSKKSATLLLIVCVGENLGKF